MSKKRGGLYTAAKGAGSSTGKAVKKGAKKSYRYVAGGLTYAGKKVNPMQTWPDRKTEKEDKPQKKKSKK